MKVLNKLTKQQLQEFDSALFKINYDSKNLEVMYPMYAHPDGVEIEVYLGQDASPTYFEVPYEVLEYYISEYFNSEDILYWLKDSGNLEKQDLLMLANLDGCMYWYNELAYGDERLKCSKWVVPQLMQDIADYQLTKLN